MTPKILAQAEVEAASNRRLQSAMAAMELSSGMLREGGHNEGMYLEAVACLV